MRVRRRMNIILCDIEDHLKEVFSFGSIPWLKFACRICSGERCLLFFPVVFSVLVEWACVSDTQILIIFFNMGKFRMLLLLLLTYA
jgi:hypothetical protein